MKMRTVIIIIIIFLFILTMSTLSIRGIVKKFKIRSDRSGKGHFGAKRKHGKHKGIDIEVTEGEKILAPFPMKLIRIAYPYPDNNFIKGGVYKTSSGKEVKIFYMKPFDERGNRIIQKGDLIGQAQSISKYYGDKNMKDHIHLEIRDEHGELENPEKYI